MDSAVAISIVVVTLFLILTDRLDHTIAAILGGAAMLGAGFILGFYSETQALEVIEFNALALLLGMMIIVSILEPTGIFQYMAVKAGDQCIWKVSAEE